MLKITLLHTENNNTLGSTRESVPYRVHAKTSIKHLRISSSARGLNFDLGLYLHPSIVYISSEGSPDS